MENSSLVHVTGLYLCKEAGEPMQSVPQVTAVAYRGLEGDRYADKKGFFSHNLKVKVRDVSIISAEALRRVQEIMGPLFKAEHTRRNILTDGISPEELEALAGQPFKIGNVEMLGAKLCTPCSRPSELSEIEGFAKMKGLGGLRAKILNSATIQLGDLLER